MFRSVWFIWVLMVACAQAQDLPLNATKEDNGQWRQGRRRSNLADSCMTNSGETGTCLTRFKCMRQLGTVNGYCGTYGVCCETNMQCGAVTRQKRTLIKSPAAFGNNLPCTYTIEAYSPNVQQLRIDFEQFELKSPVPSLTDPSFLECQDYFEAADFKLCGRNSGQHIYLDFNVAAGLDHFTLTFMISSQSTAKWRLIVTQLEGPATTTKRKSSTLSPFGGSTNSLQDLRNLFAGHHADYDLLAPPGCQQYYTEPTGTIRSFNFQDTLPVANYMSGLSYTMCIKASSSASMIEYNFSKFSLAQQQAQDPPYDESCHSTVQTPGRQEDYLMIPQGMLVKDLAYQPTYYCGNNDNLLVYASPPFILHFSSDEVTYDATMETGFSLTYGLKKL